MGQRVDVHQYTLNFSVPRENFKEKVVDQSHVMSKDEMRVCMLLLTVLDGHLLDTERDREDPLNFKGLSPKRIGEELGLKKKEVQKALDGLVGLGILETGDNTSCFGGYRFTF